jgi:hypothetical protein
VYSGSAATSTLLLSGERDTFDYKLRPEEACLRYRADPTSPSLPSSQVGLSLGLNQNTH